MGKKRKREGEKRGIHPRNKYSDNPPDFGELASLYPSFGSFVFYSRDGKPKIDWKDFNATRELTRVLLLHHHSITWWIPDGQLCPTVPNRSNYIHWIEDLLSSDIIPNTRGDNSLVKGLDIGTGANCIYPLLGASLLGWSFVGTDVTDVALEWAEWNVKSNPQISELIEIRKVDHEQELTDQNTNNSESCRDISGNTEHPNQASFENSNKSYNGPPILVGVVKAGEKFDFCMCNPPFFETMEESGLNPNTSCGGTPAEMVCPGGEQAFVSRMIQDSIQLKQSFRWYTSMVGKKSSLKSLISKLREVGVTVVKTTEFVQGQTCRWGIAWSFIPPIKKIISSHVASKNVLTFMLEGIQRKFSAFHVLNSIESFFQASGASSKSNAASFYIDIHATMFHCKEILKNNSGNLNEIEWGEALNDLHFRVTVFEQIPGTLLVRGSLKPGESSVPGLLSSIFLQLEDALRKEFCPEKHRLWESGCNDFDALKNALADYSTKVGKPLTHQLAWAVVKDQAKSAEQKCVGGTSSSHSDKRRKSSEGENYDSASNYPNTIIPDLNEDSTPTRPRQGEKNVAETSSKADSIVDAVQSYAERKVKTMADLAEKTKALLDIQIQQAINQAERQDFKYYMEPHDHIKDPTMLAWIKEKKRQLAAKYGWPCKN